MLFGRKDADIGHVEEALRMFTARPACECKESMGSASSFAVPARYPPWTRRILTDSGKQAQDSERNRQRDVEVQSVIDTG